MASVVLNVVLDPDAPQRIFQLPQCKAALTKHAKEIADRANAMSSGFRTGLYYRNHETPPVGNTQPQYGYKPAINTADRSVALVIEKNYAAMKDDHLHNTLLKARG